MVKEHGDVETLMEKLLMMYLGTSLWWSNMNVMTYNDDAQLQRLLILDQDIKSIFPDELEDPA
jgi:hypothetical protein